MDNIKIKNVDENGTEIENIDWSVWNRERTEEVLDDEGKLVSMISHCRK